jgi:hypothetical protein
MSILSLHRVSVHGKVVNLKFVSILGWNLRCLKVLKNEMYRFLSTLEHNHNVLHWVCFEGAVVVAIYR